MRNLETPIGSMRDEIIKRMRELPMMKQSRAGTAIYEELANAFAKVDPERGQVFIEENESANRMFCGLMTALLLGEAHNSSLLCYPLARALPPPAQY